MPEMPAKLDRKPWRVACAIEHITAGPGVNATSDQVARYNKKMCRFIAKTSYAA